MWLTKTKEFFKLVNWYRVVDVSIALFAFAIVVVSTLSLSSKFEKAKQELEIQSNLLNTKTLFQQQKIDSLSKVIDSLTVNLKKVTWLKEQPLQPAFEMNSKLGEVYQGIEQTGIRCPEAMFALACHETGRFTSKLSRYNNYFGLAWSKHPLVVDKVWSEGDRHFKAVFNSPQDCFAYMKEWQLRKQAKLNFSSNTQFVHSLKKVNYATHPDHGKLVLQTMNDLFDVKSLNAFIEDSNQVEKFLAIR